MPELVLPRPGSAPKTPPAPPIPGPSESSFTSPFGALLPAAKYLQVEHIGKAAYYDLPPLSNGSENGNTTETPPQRVLFLHGVQTPALGMLPLAQALHSSFPHAHFVLLDLWGHGLSDTPLLPHDASLFHALLDALLDILAWPSAHLVGFSFGGALTVGYAAKHPSRVQSFALVAPAGLIHREDFSAQEHAYLRGSFREPGVDETEARRWILEFLEGGALVVPTDWKERVQRGEVVAEALREWQMRNHAGHVASVVAIVRDGGVMDHDEWFDRAVATGIPSLAVLGGLDTVVSEGQLREHGFERVAVVPGVGHGVVRERVPEVASLISDFWMGLKGA